jgi:hypothetical protein
MSPARRVHRPFLTALAAVVATAMCALPARALHAPHAPAPQAPATPPAAPVAAKPRLAVREVSATRGVVAQAKSRGFDNALDQVLEATDAQLLDAFDGEGAFELVARGDLGTVIKEQDLSLSGNVNAMDPQAARAYQLAGARFVATVTVTNFQEIVERTVLPGQFGNANAERRTIDVQAVVKVYDTTTAALLKSTNVTVSEFATNEILAGVEQSGSKTNVVLGTAARALAEQAAARISAAAPAASPSLATPAPAGTGMSGSLPTRPMRLAIFVKQRPSQVPPEKVTVFEDLVAASATAPNIEIIRREDLVNAVNRLAPTGPNAGTGLPGSEAVDRILSDQSSAVQLATLMKADALLTVSISALQNAVRTLEDPATRTMTKVEQWTLMTTYGVIDGVTGASLGSGTVQSDFANRDSAGLQVKVDFIDPLLRDAAARIGPAAGAAVARAAERTAAAPALVKVAFDALLSDLSVPDVRKDEKGEYVVGANQYPLRPMSVQVIVDGITVGQTPGAYELRPGMHRVRFERPALEPVERVIDAREGLVVTAPMQFTPEGRANWQRDAAFFNDLKNGAVARDVDLIRIRAIADFLRQSDIRLDTTNVQNLNLGGESIWWQLLGP